MPAFGCSVYLHESFFRRRTHTIYFMHTEKTMEKKERLKSQGRGGVAGGQGPSIERPATPDQGNQ